MSSAAASLLFLLTACGSDREPERAIEERAADERPATPEPPPPPATQETLFEFTTSDGVSIAGTFVSPDAQTEGDPTSDGPVVVLVHQLGSTRAEWAPLVAALTRAPALSVLSIDLRGHGESTRRGGEALDFNTFGDDEWAKLTIDVTGAVALARERFGATRVMIAGASIGSSAAILAAASDPAVVGVVAISPGRAYHGIDSLTPMTALAGRPLLAIASTGEAHSAETARAMAAAAGGEVELYPGDAHGMRIANDSPEMIARADAFIRHALGRE